MASSLQTLVRILRHEQRTGYQNSAVIGGFARFAYHWAKEAHSQAKEAEHHTLVDELAEHLRRYEELPEAERPAEIDAIIALATGQAKPSLAEVTTESDRAATVDDSEIHITQQPPPSPQPARQTVLEDAQPSVRARRAQARRHAHPARDKDLHELEAPVIDLPRIGARRAEQLAKLGVHTVADLLTLFPRRYDDYSRLKTIDKLRVGDEVTVIGTLRKIETHQTQRGSTRIEAFLYDGTGTLCLNWFNQPWLAKKLKAGSQIVVSGKIDQYLGRLVMNSPEWELLERELLHTGRVVPVYPLTEGLTGRMMRQTMKRVIDSWADRIPDHLPLDIRESTDLMDLDDAIAQAHFPDSWQDKEDALHRLAFDELFLLQLSMLQQRRIWQSHTGASLTVDSAWLSAFEQSLPFALTDAQQRVLAEVRQDLSAAVPMTRLLQGDVGSGKTIIAAIAMGMAVTNGVQAALMAPTSILAEQHYNRLWDTLGNSPIGGQFNMGLLTGNVSQLERSAVYAGLADGSIQVVVGTHALIQEDVQFANLGLAVIDEQHRFGVEQRGALRHKAAGGNPHLLVMSATPIPRTLALTMHADLDLSIIDEMPPGRQEVETRILAPKDRERAYSFVRSQVENGRQAFVVYPLIEESGRVAEKSAVAEYERLQQTVFSDLRLALLHGRMSTDEKETAMTAFYRGEIDILVSTTVIEVGIDVPNASVMMIEGANRFGLAQLHQLRGRVGRGEHKSYCLIMSDLPNPDQDERLRALEQTTDGFELARIDWEMRGAGDLVGVRQSGFGTFRFADLMDPHLVGLAQREARKLYETDPALEHPQHAMLAQRVRGPIGTGDVS